MSGGPLILGGLDSSERLGQRRLPARRRQRAAARSRLPDRPAARRRRATLGERGARLRRRHAKPAPTRSRHCRRPAGRRGPSATANQVGRLPTVRSDLSAVTVGGRAYVLGGYDGNTPIDSVLQTADGSELHPGRDPPGPGPLLGGGGARRPHLRLRRRDGERRRERRDPRSRSAGGNRPRHRPPPPGALPRRRRRRSAAHLRTGRGRRRVAERSRSGASTPAAEGRLRRPAGSPRGLRRRRHHGRLDRLPDRRHRRRGNAPARRSSPSACAAKGSRRARPKPKNPSAASSCPFAGRLLIADRGNDRLLVVNARKQVLWRFPSRAHPAPPGGFYFPDDAFFIHGGTGIISNEEQNERIVQLSFPSGKLLWSYGHPGVDRLRTRLPARAR